MEQEIWPKLGNGAPRMRGKVCYSSRVRIDIMVSDRRASTVASASRFVSATGLDGMRRALPSSSRGRG